MMSALRKPRITDKTISAAKLLLNEGQLEVLRQIQSDQQEQIGALKNIGSPFQPGGGR